MCVLKTTFFTPVAILHVVNFSVAFSLPYMYFAFTALTLNCLVCLMYFSVFRLQNSHNTKM